MRHLIFTMKEGESVRQTVARLAGARAHEVVFYYDTCVDGGIPKYDAAFEALNEWGLLMEEAR